jgi:hypothetical protein
MGDQRDPQTVMDARDHRIEKENRSDQDFLVKKQRPVANFAGASQKLKSVPHSK